MSRNLTEDEWQALDRTLSQLMDCDLTEWETDFVDDMADKIDRYGTGVVLSERQRAQINRLKGKYDV